MLEIIQGKFKTVRCDAYHIIALGGAGTLLLSLAFYFFLHQPLSIAVEDYKAQAAKNAREVTVIANFQNAHLNFKEYQAEIAQREKRVFGYLPADMGQAEFILAIERLALRHKMQLETISPQKLVAGKDALCLPIKVGLTGSYFGLLKFLRGLQDGERLVSIRNMSVKVKETGLAVEMLLYIYAVPVK